MKSLAEGAVGFMKALGILGLTTDAVNDKLLQA